MGSPVVVATGGAELHRDSIRLRQEGVAQLRLLSLTPPFLRLHSDGLYLSGLLIFAVAELRSRLHKSGLDGALASA